MIAQAPMSNPLPPRDLPRSKKNNVTFRRCAMILPMWWGGATGTMAQNVRLSTILNRGF
jgi:hypothetical protein